MTVMILVIPIGTFLIDLAIRRSLADAHHAGLALLEGFALVTGFKRWMNLVGRLRPDYLARLQLANAGDIANGHQSYPSGHASYMFMSMTLTSLYLLGRSKVFVRQLPGTFLVAGLCIAPVGLATYVALTRPFDYKHHFSDINAGMALGLATAVFAYFLNYPSLLAPNAGCPKLRSFEIAKGVEGAAAGGDSNAAEPAAPALHENLCYNGSPAQQA